MLFFQNQYKCSTRLPSSRSVDGGKKTSSLLGKPVDGRSAMDPSGRGVCGILLVKVLPMVQLCLFHNNRLRNVEIGLSHTKCSLSPNDTIPTLWGMKLHFRLVLSFWYIFHFNSSYSRFMYKTLLNVCLSGCLLRRIPKYQMLPFSQ